MQQIAGSSTDTAWAPSSASAQRCEPSNGMNESQWNELSNVFAFRDADVRSILLQKPDSKIQSIGPDRTVFEAIGEMVQHRIGALMVMQDRKRLVGVISERDYMGKVILRGLSSRTTLVGQIMTTNLITVKLDTPAVECMKLISQNRVRHLPVVEFDNVTARDELLGVVSIGDILKYVLSQQNETIAFLRTYIERTY